MQELCVFNFDQSDVRVTDRDGEPWFVAKDVAEALGYANAYDAIAKHVDAEDKGVANRETLGGKQGISVINESGLYSLILKSKKPEARKFKRWVTSEVLPALRKRGSYGASQAIDMNNLAALVATATAQATTQILEQTLKLQNHDVPKNKRLQVEPFLLPSLERGNIRDRVHGVAKATPFGEREIYDCLYRNLALMPEFQKYKASFFAARKDRGTSALAWLDSLGLLPPRGEYTVRP